MVNKLPRSHKATVVLGAATVMMLCLPCSTHAQASTPQDQQQDRQAGQSDDVMRRDVARFDQFLDNHHEISDQLRKTPALVDDPQFLQDHPELNTYLQDHPSVKQEISQHPDTFMSLEDRYGHDRGLRDRDAGGQDRDADRRDDADHRDADRNADGRDNGGRTDANRGNVSSEEANFDRFMDSHREIAEQVRKDPSLLNNQSFVQNHPALQTYLQQNPGVRERLSEDPKGFTYHADANDHDSNRREPDPMHAHMADFGGFLRSHNDVRIDLSKNPSVIKDHEYVENHAELVAYLDAHPDIRAELMANPQGFVHGAQQYASGSPSGAGSGRGTGTTGSGTGTTGSVTGTSTTSPTTTHEPTKPN
jgi:hypothetical protein